MLNDFPVKLGKKDVAKTPAGDNLFNLGTRTKLDTKRLAIFHTFMAKGLFLCKRARPDIQQAILVLYTKVVNDAATMILWTKLFLEARIQCGKEHCLSRH
jgi:hypothetical protein